MDIFHLTNKPVGRLDLVFHIDLVSLLVVTDEKQDSGKALNLVVVVITASMLLSCLVYHKIKIKIEN